MGASNRQFQKEVYPARVNFLILALNLPNLYCSSFFSLCMWKILEKSSVIITTLYQKLHFHFLQSYQQPGQSSSKAVITSFKLTIWVRVRYNKLLTFTRSSAISSYTKVVFSWWLSEALYCQKQQLDVYNVTNPVSDIRLLSVVATANGIVSNYSIWLQNLKNSDTVFLLKKYVYEVWSKISRTVLNITKLLSQLIFHMEAFHVCFFSQSSVGGQLGWDCQSHCRPICCHHCKHLIDRLPTRHTALSVESIRIFSLFAND